MWGSDILGRKVRMLRNSVFLPFLRVIARYIGVLRGVGTSTFREYQRITGN